MAAKKKPAKKKTPQKAAKRPLIQRFWRWAKLSVLVVCLAMVALTLLFRFVNPPTTITMLQAGWWSGDVKYDWIDIADVTPDLPRALVAAEDARFCAHAGFDIKAIRAVIQEGSKRGASTITQQTAKNVFLWQTRSWIRKAFEAGFTLLVELFWSKERILEVYMNIAEFDEGVFGIKAAAKHYFGLTPAKLTGTQAARLAAVLPNPKARSASKPSASQKKRANSILSGANTIKADGRAACFTPEP